jgi:hypothetical protein
MKKIHTFYIDDDVYKEFKIYSVIIGKSISQLLEEYIKDILKKQNK